MSPVFPAGRSSACPYCPRPIVKGQLIRRGGGNGYGHAEHDDETMLIGASEYNYRRRIRSEGRKATCPECGARAGEMCVGARGKPRDSLHAERYHAAGRLTLATSDEQAATEALRAPLTEDERSRAVLAEIAAARAARAEPGARARAFQEVSLPNA